jgi:hypothetical protein
MTTDAEIIREYEANEAEAAKLVPRVDSVDLKVLVELTAKRLDVAQDRVADVMSAYWAGQGAG